jgi:hypothetical protein
MWCTLTNTITDEPPPYFQIFEIVFKLEKIFEIVFKLEKILEIVFKLEKIFS